MTQTICSNCQAQVEKLNESCRACGFHLVLEPDEQRQARFLKGPSLGALLFTQGWTFGARLYVWFLLSLIPVVGIVALIACVFFGRRWSWKYGGWESWQVFQTRMRTLDMIGGIWMALLFGFYVWQRYTFA